MKTSFSLCGNTTQGKPCSGPVLALYWPCTGLQCIRRQIWQILDPSETLKWRRLKWIVPISTHIFQIIIESNPWRNCMVEDK